MKELELAYLAGFFDGEGSIGIMRRKKVKSKNYAYYASISVGQKDKAIINTLQKHFRGGIHKVKRDGSYMWYCTDKTAYECIKQLLPYLRYKKPQAELVVSLYEEAPNRTKFNMLPQTELIRRELLYNKIRTLKKVVS